MVRNQKQQSRQYYLGHSKNGVKVTYNPKSSHLSTHLEDTPNLKELMIEAVSKIDLNGQIFAGDVNMGRIVGTCDVVEVSNKNKIVYGIRKNRYLEGLVPFVKYCEGEESPYVSLYLEPRPDGTYEAGSAWIGTFDDEPFPLAPNSNDKSIKYWDSHAFVYGSQEIETNTEQITKPW